MAKMPYELRRGCVKNCEKQIAHFWHLESSLRDVTVLFTKLPDGLPPYRMTSGHHSVWRFPIDIFLFCRERPVTKEPVAL